MKAKRFLMIAAGLMLTASAFAGPQPEYPGGKEALDQYIVTNMIYPQSAIDNGIEGVVDVAFIVKTDGSIGSIKIVRMVDPDLESEAIRLVKGMPHWIPAEKNGVPFDAQTQVDVNFVLP